MYILNEQIRAMLEEPDMIACLSNLSACIKETWPDLNWAGFYLVKDGELVLGPFQGKPACTHIPFDRGVCGLTCTSKKAQRVNDVLSFPGHIACDSASRSELCVPVLVNGECVMEIDLDSPAPGRFDLEMETIMLQAAEDIASAFLQHSW